MLNAMMQESEPKEIKQETKHFVGTIVALQMILLLAALDQTVIATAMPRIISQLGGFDRYAWATTAYLLTSTMTVPVLGKVSDLYGRKITLSCSVILFICASLLCGLAGKIYGLPGDGMDQLIWARLAQGIGGGAIVGLSFSVVADLLPPRTRGRYQGLFAGVFAVASTVGPALGGYVADVASWRWLFFINLPLGLLGLLIFVLCFPEKMIVKQKADFVLQFDLQGVFAFCLGTATLLLGLSASPDRQPMTFQWLWFVTSALAFILFVVFERRAKAPFLPLSLFGNRLIVISLLFSGCHRRGYVWLNPSDSAFYAKRVRAVGSSIRHIAEPSDYQCGHIQCRRWLLDVSLRQVQSRDLDWLDLHDCWCFSFISSDCAFIDPFDFDLHVTCRCRTGIIAAHLYRCHPKCCQ